MEKKSRYDGKRRITFIVSEEQAKLMMDGLGKMKKYIGKENLTMKEYILILMKEGIRARNDFRQIMKDLEVPSKDWEFQTKWRLEHMIELQEKEV